MRSRQGFRKRRGEGDRGEVRVKGEEGGKLSLKGRKEGESRKRNHRAVILTSSSFGTYMNSTCTVHVHAFPCLPYVFPCLPYLAYITLDLNPASWAASVAQLAEHWTSNPVVTGSNPVRGSSVFFIVCLRTMPYLVLPSFAYTCTRFDHVHVHVRYMYSTLHEAMPTYMKPCLHT